MTALQKWILVVMCPWMLFYAGYTLHKARSKKKGEEKEPVFSPVHCPKCYKELQHIYGLAHWLCPVCGSIWTLGLVHKIEKPEFTTDKDAAAAVTGTGTENAKRQR